MPLLKISPDETYLYFLNARDEEIKLSEKDLVIDQDGKYNLKLLNYDIYYKLNNNDFKLFKEKFPERLIGFPDIIF